MTNLIDDLVNDLEPVSHRPLRHLALRWILPALTISALFVVLWIGVRPDMPGALSLPSFWVKLAAMVAIAAGAALSLFALSRPDGSSGRGLVVSMLVAGLVLAAGLVVLAIAPSDMRTETLLGHSWNRCVPRVMAAALPVFAASILVLRAMAPTRLRLAGFAAGLFAGAAGAAVYSLSCTETSLTFLAVWYQGAVLIVALLGALMGPRLLRW